MENTVKLRVKSKEGKGAVKEFDKNHAIKILSLPNSAWELNETGLEWNGKDIVSKQGTEKK